MLSLSKHEAVLTDAASKQKRRPLARPALMLVFWSEDQKWTCSSTPYMRGRVGV